MLTDSSIIHSYKSRIVFYTVLNYLNSLLPASRTSLLKTYFFLHLPRDMGSPLEQSLKSQSNSIMILPCKVLYKLYWIGFDNCGQKSLPWKLHTNAQLNLKIFCTHVARPLYLSHIYHQTLISGGLPSSQYFQVVKNLKFFETLQSLLKVLEEQFMLL